MVTPTPLFNGASYQASAAMTLTLAAVYAPVAFMTGRTGKLFIEFALTLAGAVLVSGFVALTLTPMMCSKLLRHNPSPNRFDRGNELWIDMIAGQFASVSVAVSTPAVTKVKKL